MRYNIVALDFDGVLVEQESAWWTLHKEFGTYHESKSNLFAYENGEIDYVEFMRRDITLWGRRTLTEVKEILLNYDLNLEARSFVDRIKNDGRKVVIVSAGIDVLVGDVAQKLGIEDFLANGLETDGDDYLTGHGIFRVDLKRKDLALKKLVEQQGGEMTEVVAVGDSKYDLHFLGAAGLGIGFGNAGKHNDLNKVADRWATKLTEIPKIIKNSETA